MSFRVLSVCVLLVVVSSCRGTRRSDALRSYVDLSYWLGDDTQIWPGHMPYNMTVLQIPGLGPRVVQSEAVSHSSHFSTHIDAPIHFTPWGWTLDQIPNENLYGPGIVIDAQEKATKIPNYAVTREDLENFERKHGRIPERAIVFFNTGWGSYWNDTVKYLGTDTADTSKLAYPGLSKEGAEFLVHERNINGIGFDSISLDPADSPSYAAHIVLSDANKWGIEATANLHLLPPKGFQVYVFPLKLYKSSGASARVIAFL